MRATAKEVGTELEATRSELSRGVMELPEETRASAAAMRRVVAEQIEALAELNAIVKSQPATHDLNDRRAAPPPPPRREEPAPRPAPAPEPVREPAPIARAVPEMPRVEAPVRETPRPEPVRATNVSAPPRAEARPAPAPRPSAPPPMPAVPARATAPAPRPAPAPAPAPAAEAKAGEEGGGWLRDVLRNASATGPAAQPAPAAAPQQGLTSLTDEIAKSMDQTALAEAWRRYQAGEQAVFSRRIYTLTGQGTYDDVRKRIQRDADFAKTAQTYMSEFEQLLQQAANAANPAEEALAYLLSDRGKVYTMLAHASGRLG
jgi:hypothetical protein